MRKFLFTKKVDKSLLRAGLTLPVNKCSETLSAVGAVLGKGSRATITVKIDDSAYSAILSHVNLSSDKRDVYQIRYGAGSEICKKLNEVFADGDASSYIEVWNNGDKTLAFKCFANSIKSDFLKYLGSADSLAGYQKSYKLVYYKCFFSEALYNERIETKQLVREFRQYYIDRVRFGLLPDKDVDTVIANPLESTDSTIYSLIMRNPFNAISGKGFFDLQTIDGTDYFCMKQELYQALKDQDLELIRDTVYQKLTLHYRNIGNE